MSMSMGRYQKMRLRVPNNFRFQGFLSISICFFIIFFSLLSSGCLKKTVGRWDSDSIGDLIIVDFRKNGTRLEVDIIMTNNNFTRLPIHSVWFNVYDTDNNRYTCSWTNYSSLSKTQEIVYNETFHITLVFGNFHDNDITRTPDILEYSYPNNNKRVSFTKIDENEILLDSLSWLLIGAGIVVIAIIIIIIFRKKKKSFMG